MRFIKTNTAEEITRIPNILNVQFSKLPIIAFSLTFLFTGCSTTRTYSLPFSSAEKILYNSLHLKKEIVLNQADMAQAKVQGELAKQMSMQLFEVKSLSNEPGKYLSFTVKHSYNIGANGGEYIHFELIARENDITMITVNYTDKWVGIWPPFVFWNPGFFREHKIHNAIWGNRKRFGDVPPKSMTDNE